MKITKCLAFSKFEHNMCKINGSNLNCKSPSVKLTLFTKASGSIKS